MLGVAVSVIIHAQPVQHNQQQMRLHVLTGRVCYLGVNWLATPLALQEQML
jgi:hypothetical protein